MTTISAINVGAQHSATNLVKAVPLSAAPGKKSPLFWFMLNVHEWSGDSRFVGLTDYQAGWLLRLRMEAWKRECHVPNDLALLAKWAKASPKKFEKEFDAMVQYFVPTGDGSVLEDVELRQEWDDKLAKVKKNRENGALGGRQAGPGKTT